MIGLDHSFFRAVNGLHGLDPVMLFFSGAMNYLWVKITLVVWVGLMLRAGERWRVGILTALVAVGLSNPITDAFKKLAPALRPFKDPAMMNDVILRIGSKSDEVGFGTASAHSANMAAVATALWWTLGWRWGAPWAVIALLTGMSRVYNGVHYPWQVLLGWTVGFVVATGLTFAWRSFERRKHREAV